MASDPTTLKQSGCKQQKAGGYPSSCSVPDPLICCAFPVSPKRNSVLSSSLSLSLSLAKINNPQAAVWWRVFGRRLVLWRRSAGQRAVRHLRGRNERGNNVAPAGLQNRSRLLPEAQILGGVSKRSKSPTSPFRHHRTRLASGRRQVWSTRPALFAPRAECRLMAARLSSATGIPTTRPAPVRMLAGGGQAGLLARLLLPLRVGCSDLGLFCVAGQAQAMVCCCRRRERKRLKCMVTSL